MKYFYLYFLTLASSLFAIAASPAGPVTCEVFNLSSTCINDGIYGCHIGQSSSCRLTSPEGCRVVSCNSSCPSPGGYYVPHNNLTAWNAFKANVPSSMTISRCLSACTGAGQSANNVSECCSGLSLCSGTTSVSSCPFGSCTCETSCSAPPPSGSWNAVSSPTLCIEAPVGTCREIQWFQCLNGSTPTPIAACPAFPPSGYSWESTSFNSGEPFTCSNNPGTCRAGNKPINCLSGTMACFLDTP